MLVRTEPLSSFIVAPVLGFIGATTILTRGDRCWLKGAEGDALHAVLCAAGFNIRWLLRAIVNKGLAALLFALSKWTLYVPTLPLIPLRATAPQPEF